MDLSYRGAFPHPRFTNGAFNAALEAVFERHTGRKLRVLRFGKPESSSFQHAETVLAPDPALRKTMQFYMIGDNPRSDIAGARAANQNFGTNFTASRSECHGFPMAQRAGPHRKLSEHGGK